MTDNAHKPPPPVKPTEKLPMTYHLTLVSHPDRSAKMLTLVAMKMQGDEVKKRVVLQSFALPQEALDELNRTAVRIFYFEEPEIIFGAED